jgi:hypothetical protein
MQFARRDVVRIGGVSVVVVRQQLSRMGDAILEAVG